MSEPNSYLQEFRAYRRYLAAATLGMAAGYSLVNYINNLFTPHLLQDFGWTRSQLALVTSVNIINILALPIAGRLTDYFGVKRVALVGVIIAPLVWFGLSMMNGELWVYFALNFIQFIVIGSATSVIVYSRLIAQTFDRARGIALAITASAAPVVAVISVPFLSGFIDTSGWRAGYAVVGVGVAIVGAVAVSLIPADTESRQSIRPPGQASSTPFREIMRIPAFRFIVVGVILCNLSFMLQTAHLKVLLLDRGIDSDMGTMAISLFAASVILGRLVCGIALDRFPAYAVTAIAMALPGIGLGILATGTSVPLMIAAAVLLLGFSLGAEGDVLAYVVRKYFKMEIFSTVLGLVLSGLALSVTAGSLLLSLALKLTGTYTAFMVIASVAAFIGSSMFLRLKRESAAQ